jgi:hypothetical protein
MEEDGGWREHDYYKTTAKDINSRMEEFLGNSQSLV